VHAGLAPAEAGVDSGRSPRRGPAQASERIRSRRVDNARQRPADPAARGPFDTVSKRSRWSVGRIGESTIVDEHRTEAILGGVECTFEHRRRHRNVFDRTWFLTDRSAARGQHDGEERPRLSTTSSFGDT